MYLVSIDDNEELSLEFFSKNECSRIFLHRNSYILECHHTWGEDYGGSQYTEEKETYYREISNEEILVKDGRFFGVRMIVEYDYYNGGGSNSIEEVYLKAEGDPKSYARSGFSFSNDDHSRWDYTDFYLIERPDGV